MTQQTMRVLFRGAALLVLAMMPAATNAQPLGRAGSWMFDVTGTGQRFAVSSDVTRDREVSAGASVRFERFVLPRVSLGLHVGLNGSVRNTELLQSLPSVTFLLPERSRVAGVTVGPVASVLLPLGPQWFVSPLARAMFTQQERATVNQTQDFAQVERRREFQLGAGLGRRIGDGAIVAELRRHATTRHETWSGLTLPTEWAWRGSLAVRIFFP